MKFRIHHILYILSAFVFLLVILTYSQEQYSPFNVPLSDGRPPFGISFAATLFVVGFMLHLITAPGSIRFGFPLSVVTLLILFGLFMTVNNITMHSPDMTKYDGGPAYSMNGPMVIVVGVLLLVILIFFRKTFK